MTNIIFQKKELEDSLGVKINHEILEKISLFGTPLERSDAKEIEIEVFPNRPDLISISGFSRSFKSFLGIQTGLKKYKVSKPEKDFNVTITDEVKSIRPYTVCAIVKNLTFNDEKIKDIINLQEKLHITIGRNRKKVAVGIYPLEKIKLPITYTAKNPGDIKFQPLDYKRELNGKQILMKHPAGIKYSHLLKDYNKFPIFIDSKSSILSMPPIINSNDTGKITKETKEVFVECSGSNFQTLQKTLNIIVTALSDMNGKIYQMEIINGKSISLTPNFSPEKMKISLQNTNKLLGLKLNESELSKLLSNMGFDYKSGTVYIPAWRTDILHEVDIIEDIAIAYGYDNFAPEIPNISTIGEESKESKIKRLISEILVGMQALEISTYHLIKEKESSLFKLKNSIDVLDSKSEYKILRPNLLIPSFRILSENLDAEYPQKIYEIGTVFNKSEEYETKIKENDNLILSITPSNFTEIKQNLNYFMQTIGIKFQIKEITHPQLIEGRTASILVNNKEIGYLGEVHPITLKKWGLKMPLAVFEISLDDIYKLL